MDYEEKYKKVLEKIQGLLDGAKRMGHIIVRVEDIENTFPELAESEDEEIRKVLIDYFKTYKEQEECGIETFFGIPTDNILAWLEKQGQKSIWHNEDEEPQRGSLILLIMQSGTPIVAKIIEPNHTFNHGERWAYIDDLLEKQGEQESAEWSKEDEEHYQACLQYFDVEKPDMVYYKDYQWLKSLKQRIGG